MGQTLALLLLASILERGLEGEDSSTILDICEWSLRCLRTFFRYRSKLLGGRSQTAADGGTARVSVKVSPHERVKKSLCFPKLNSRAKIIHIVVGFTHSYIVPGL